GNLGFGSWARVPLTAVYNTSCYDTLRPPSPLVLGWWPCWVEYGDSTVQEDLMTLASRLFHRTGLVALLGAAVLGLGCAKKVTPPPPPKQEAPPPARPTVTLQANPTTINKGESSTLTWNSTDATQLSIDPGVGTVTAEGSTKVSPTDSTTYTITATGPGGSATATAAVSVNAPPP